MAINKNRLAIVTAGAWTLASLAITQALPDTRDMTNFSIGFLLLLHPALVVFGWRWVSEGDKVPFKLWGNIMVLNFIGAFLMLSHRTYQDFGWLPFLTLAVMLMLISIFDSRTALWNDFTTAIINSWTRPPVWLILIIVTMAWLTTQTVINMFTPSINLAFFIACGVTWGVHLLLKK